MGNVEKFAWISIATVVILVFLSSTKTVVEKTFDVIYRYTQELSSAR